MPNDQDAAIKNLAADWLRKAKADLRLAEMVGDARISLEIIVFHSQQAVEKALKALLVYRQVEFPRTHAIGPLLNLCQVAGYPGTDEFLEVVVLTQYAVASRYPGEEEPVGQEEAEKAVIFASRVVGWAVEQMIAQGERNQNQNSSS